MCTHTRARSLTDYGSGTGSRNAPATVAVTIAALVPVCAAVLYFVVFAGSRWVQPVYACAKLFTVVWPLVAARFIEHRPIDVLGNAASRHRASLAVGLATGLIIAGLILVAYWLTPVGDYARQHGDRLTAKLVDLHVQTPLRFVTFALFLSILHSAIEEWFWRWYIFGRLSCFVPVRLAHLLAAIAFSLHHFVILSTYFSIAGTLFFGLATLVGGLIWSVMYKRFGSLAGCWVSHVLVDAAIMIAGYDIVFG